MSDEVGMWSSVLVWLISREIVQILATLALIFVTMGLWRATRSLADTSRKGREDAIRPLVVVKLKLWKEHNDFMDLVLGNVGTGAALDVSFRLNGDIDDLTAHGVLLRGTSAPIGFLAPGETVTFPLGNTRKIISEDGKTPLKAFSVVCEYSDTNRHMCSVERLVDVRQFKGLRWRTNSIAYRQLQVLQKIEKHLGSTSI